MPSRSIPSRMPRAWSSIGPWHHGPHPQTSTEPNVVETGGSMATRKLAMSRAVSRPPFSFWWYAICAAMSPT